MLLKQSLRQSIFDTYVFVFRIFSVIFIYFFYVAGTPEDNTLLYIIITCAVTALLIIIIIILICVVCCKKKSKAKKSKQKVHKKEERPLAKEVKYTVYYTKSDNQTSRSDKAAKMVFNITFFESLNKTPPKYTWQSQERKVLRSKKFCSTYRKH